MNRIWVVIQMLAAAAVLFEMTFTCEMVTTIDPVKGNVKHLYYNFWPAMWWEYLIAIVGILVALSFINIIIRKFWELAITVKYPSNREDELMTYAELDRKDKERRESNRLRKKEESKALRETKNRLLEEAKISNKKELREKIINTFVDETILRNLRERECSLETVNERFAIIKAHKELFRNGQYALIWNKNSPIDIIDIESENIRNDTGAVDGKLHEVMEEYLIKGTPSRAMAAYYWNLDERDFHVVWMEKPDMLTVPAHKATTLKESNIKNMTLS